MERGGHERGVTIEKALVALLCAGCSWPSSVPCAQEGRLESVRSAVRDEPEEVDDEHEDDHDHDDDPWDDSGPEDGTVIGWWLEQVFLCPFTLPRRALADQGLGAVYFRDYPGEGGPGYWLVAPEEGSHPKRWSTLVLVEAGSDGDDLERLGGVLRVEHASRLGLDFSFGRWTEDLAAGGEDELWLGDANVVYRFANGASTAFRVGAGVNWLADGGDEDFGFDFTYGAQWFLDALELDAELDLGDLGTADLAHARVALGYHVGRAALTLAYDGYDIAGIDLDSLSLGLAAWF